ncbi:MAG: CRISPR system precrRNA processing endoribonuclease RAMP protein Cas6 [Leptolyngbya sp. BL-A-14]
MEPMLSLPRLKSTALQTLVIHLGAANSRNLFSTCGRAIHAQVMEWFHLSQPELAQAIHNSQVSPISLSGLVSKHLGRPILEGEEFYFRIGLLQGDLLAPLLQGLELWGSTVVLAEFPFVIKNINLLAGTDPLIRSSDYAQLAQVPSHSKTLMLRFLTPTNFKFNQGQHTQPIPLPDAVFGSLQRRWDSFAPPGLRFSKIQWNGVIYDFEIKSQHLRLGNIDELGAVGWVKYHFPDPEQARIANILAHFAFFSGVGRKTAMGMGQTFLEGTTNLYQV